ncbi:GLPGLI family protein [Soonwooa sp.]|uniref:GLPGLI family protein n=1 Tax=Soonwooa sp. TaxID=1938592 RepID=UPI002608FD5F|nr:GLPGLI family protein [Soonwooa sp.]
MKILSIFFLFVSVFFFSQSQRFMYEYSYRLDSLHKDKVEKEIMNLDITKSGSNFYSALLVSRDSLLHAQIERGRASKSIVLDATSLRRSKANFRISKMYPSFETFYHTSINADNFSIKELNKISWKILPDTMSIEGFKSQKATTEFGGRKWTAWFTSVIPIQDGPYKFANLPGLILNVADDKGDHNFKFVGSQKISEEPAIMELKRQEISISKEKFNQYWNEYKKDPAKVIKLLHGNSEMSETIFMGPNGSPLTKQDLIKRKEEGAKAYFKNYNNFIELDYYK